MSGLRFQPGPGEDPFSVFFKGFSNAVKAAEVSDYFYDKGYHNRIAYQKIYNQHFRLFMALRFDNIEVAKEVVEKYTNTILFGYKIHLSFFKKQLAGIYTPRINSIFMQDKLRKLRAQATHRPFFYRTRFHGHYSPVRFFRPRPRRRSRSRSRGRSRSSSSDSDSISPDRKRRDRSRDSPTPKRRRHRSHSPSRSSRSTSRSETPTRFSPSSSHSKRSSSNDKTSTYPNHVRKVCSKVTVVENQHKKFSDSSRSSKEHSQECGSPTKGKHRAQSPSKERFMSNFSPVSFGSDDDAMLMTPTPEPTTTRDPQKGAAQNDQSAASYFTLNKSTPPTEAWIQSEGDTTPDGGTPSPRGPGNLSRGTKHTDKPCHSVYGKVGPFTEIRATDRPWQLKPLTVQDQGSPLSKQTEAQFVIKSPSSRNGSGTAPFGINENNSVGNRIVVQTNRPEAGFIGSPSSTSSSRHPSLSSPPRPHIHPSPHEGAWSPGSNRLQSPTSSFGASPPKVNGVRKVELNQSKLEKLQAKKEEIIKAYKQDCDTFATVVRMLIRKDPELEQRLQHALRENLTEIGQRCVQELQDTVEQIKD
ncbi:serine/arginine repetitive matrix protein 2-like isoform X2 [Patiria miniata]|uniref:Periphilin-1 C-terminal domain-containing protein n=1 Tax=Patiria miniata TaxID=46514 RepID=A0A913ZS99_PATMI|nr:serine/arginine repetitive matrix protein 2-like isoform X2 [Patiria miniata]